MTKSIPEVWAKKLEVLESRNAFQDDVIDKLNQELAIHQQEIVELKYQLKIIASRLKDPNNATDGSSQEIEPPPPHY